MPTHSIVSLSCPREGMTDMTSCPHRKSLILSCPQPSCPHRREAAKFFWLVFLCFQQKNIVITCHALTADRQFCHALSRHALRLTPRGNYDSQEQCCGWKRLCYNIVPCSERNAVVCGNHEFSDNTTSTKSWLEVVMTVGLLMLIQDEWLQFG